MINFLHTNIPSKTLVYLGPISLKWYGFFMSLGIVAAILISLHLNKKYFHFNKSILLDLTFWLILNGLVGARVYDVLLELPYYLAHPLQIIQVWKGGLAIHGAIIAGIITIFFFSKKHNLSFFKVTSLIVPGLALGQSIGRFGNYFNQELFGLPTRLAWGIPISPAFRPLAYLNESHFHPTFLYESIGSLLIFLTLLLCYHYFAKNQKSKHYFYTWITALYMILYSVMRFLLEFIRIDYAPEFLNLRWPQIISIIIIIVSFFTIKLQYHTYAKTRE